MSEGLGSTSSPALTAGPDQAGSVELLEAVVQLLHEASWAAAAAGRTTLAASHHWAALEVHCLY